MSPRSTRLLIAIPLTALALAGVAACGGHGGDPAKRQAFRDCMSQHGVTMQPHAQGDGQQHERGTPPPGVDQQTWQAARQACTGK